LLNVGAALCLANAMPAMVHFIAVGLAPVGPAAALMLVVLPGFLYLWLSTIWLMKVLQRSMLMR
jgi:hypothetical protein